MLYFVVKVKTQVCFYSSYNVPCPWGPAWRSAARLVSALGQRESASSPLHARRCMRPPFLVFLHSGSTHQRMIERALVNQLIGLTDTRKWFIQSFIVKPSFSFFSAAEARPRELLGHRVAEPTFSLFLLSGEDLLSWRANERWKLQAILHPRRATVNRLLGEFRLFSSVFFLNKTLIDLSFFFPL